MTRLLLAAVVGLVAAGVALGEGVAVKPGLVPGRTLEYEIAFTLERGLALGGGRDRLVQKAGVNLTIESVDEAGIATVRGSMGWVWIDLDRASFRVSVDSREILGDSPNKAETTIREMVAKYLESEFTMLVSPLGEVLDLSGFEPVTEYIGGKDGSLARLAAGRLMPETLARDLEPIWNADGAAGRTLDEGDEWTATRTSELMGPVQMKLETPFVVEGVAGGSVKAKGEMAISIEVPEDVEMPIEFELPEQSGEAMIEWDAGVGAVRKREATTSYTIVVGLPDGTEQGSQRSGSSSLELVSVGGAG